MAAEPNHPPLLNSLCPMRFIDKFLRPQPKLRPKIYLPPEIYKAIITYRVNSVVTSRDVRQYRHEQETSAQGRALLKLALVSKSFSVLVRETWNPYWPVTTRGQWALARPVVFFRLFIRPVDLSSFKHLRFVSLDLERAFRYTDGLWHNLPFRAVLPPSVEEIELLWTHSPEHELIDLVKRHCPRVITLRIVTCNILNNPTCPWWSGHQLTSDHDQCLKGVDRMQAMEYARSIASHVRDLPRLRNLHIGVYFISFEAITTHRSSPAHIRYHPIKDSTQWVDGIHTQSMIQFQAAWAGQNPGFPLPNLHLDRPAERRLWTTRCPPCDEQWSELSEHAERAAASMLAIDVPHLETVSFSSFVAEQRTYPSEWAVSRAEVPLLDGGKQVWIRTKRPGAHRLWGFPTEFRHSGTEWVYIDHE